MSKRALEDDASAYSGLKLKVARIVAQAADVDLSNAFALTASTRRVRQPLLALRLPRAGASPVDIAIDSTGSLNISNNPFLNERELRLLAGLTQGNLMPALSAISVENTDVSDTFIDALTKAAPSLASVNLSGNPSLTDSALLMLAMRCPQLRSLSVSNCANVSDEGLDFVIRALNVNLLRLEVSNCPKVSNATATKLADHCPRLQSVRTSGSAITASGLCEVITACRDLIELDMAHSDVGSFELALVAKCLSNLQHLDVSFCFNVTEGDLLKLLAASWALEVRVFGLISNPLTFDAQRENKLLF